MIVVVDLKKSSRGNPGTELPLTGPGGALELPAVSMPYAAVTKNGDFFCVPGHEEDLGVPELVKRAAGLEINLGKPAAADLDRINALYGRVKNVERHATEARERYFAIIGEAARLGASDFEIRSRHVAGDVKYKIHGAWGKPRQKLTAIDVMTLNNVAFNAANAGDSIAKNNISLQTSITAAGILPKGVIGVRQQYDPGADGTSLIVRLLYSSESLSLESIEEAGYSDKQLECFHRALSSESGVITIAGPTESGKSTSLNCAISAYVERFTGTPNIRAIEDPPETSVEAVFAMSVNRSVKDVGEAYDEALLAALRASPDAIKIGEIRSKVTAEAAFRAASAGSLVLTTTHARSALSIPHRFQHLKLSPGDAYGDMNLLWASQRLMPLVCPDCAVGIGDGNLSKLKANLQKYFRDHIGAGRAVVFRGDGCGRCDPAPGIVGRKLISEVILPEPWLLEELADAHHALGVIRKDLILNREWPTISISAWPFVLSGRIAFDDFVEYGGNLEEIALMEKAGGRAPWH